MADLLVIALWSYLGLFPTAYFMTERMVSVVSLRISDQIVWVERLKAYEQPGVAPSDSWRLRCKGCPIRRCRTCSECMMSLYPTGLNEPVDRHPQSGDLVYRVGETC
jgi:hypothetical protein